MNKLLTKIAGLTLGLTMAIGVGVATFATADEPVGVHAAAGTLLKTYNTNSSSFSTGYKRCAGDNFVFYGQKNYFGTNKAETHNGAKPTAQDLPVVKAVDSSATTSTTGLYYLYTTEKVANVGKMEISFSAKSGSSKVYAYAVSSTTKASSGSSTWSKISLAGNSTHSQGVNVSSQATYTFDFSTCQTTEQYYGFVFQTSSYWRATGLTLKLYEGNVTYTVTYDPNGGEVSTSNETVSKGGNPTFPTPTFDGYNFNGWQVNGSGTYYTNSNASSYTVNGDVTFVASWSAASMESISLAGPSFVYVGNIITLTATAENFSPDNFEWKTSNESVATISNNSNTATVSAVSKGTTIITVSAKGSNGDVTSNEFLVTVKQFSISLSSNDVSMKSSMTKTISVSTTDAEGSVVISAVSNDTNVATVSVDGSTITITSGAIGNVDTTIVVTAKDNNGETGYHSDSKIINVQVLGGYTIGSKITSLPKNDTLVYLMAINNNVSYYVKSDIKNTSTNFEEASLFYLSNNGALQQYDSDTSTRGKYIYNGGSNTTISAGDNPAEWGSGMDDSNYPGLLQLSEGRFLAIDNSGVTKAYASNNLGTYSSIYAYAAVSSTPTVSLNQNSIEGLKGENDNTTISLTLSNFIASSLDIRYMDDGETIYASSSNIVEVNSTFVTGVNPVSITYKNVGKTTVKFIVNRTSGSPFELTIDVNVLPKINEIAIQNELVDNYLEVRNSNSGSQYGYKQLNVVAKDTDGNDYPDNLLTYEVISGSEFIGLTDAHRVYGKAVGEGVVKVYATNLPEVYDEISVKSFDDSKTGVKTVLFNGDLTANAGDILSIESVFKTRTAQTYFNKENEQILDSELKFSYVENDYDNAVSAENFVYMCDETTAVGETEQQTVYVYCTLDKTWSKSFKITVTQTDIELTGLTITNVVNNELDLLRNTTFQLSVAFNPANATNKDVRYYIDESSEEGHSVTVSETGLISAGKVLNKSAIVVVESVINASICDMIIVNVTREAMTLTIQTSEKFEKVTSIEQLTDGQYIIVSENSNVVLKDAENSENNDATYSSIEEDVVTLKQYCFTYNATAKTLMGKNGKYIGKEAEANGMDISGTEQYVNEISFEEDGDANIVGAGGSSLRYNTSWKGFRYYKSGQQAIQMYKLVGGDEHIEIGDDLFDCLMEYYYSEEFFACDPKGLTFDGASWNEIGELIIEYKDSYKLDLAKADSEGNEVERFLATYDYVVGKYGAEYDYLGRISSGVISVSKNNSLTFEINQSIDSGTLILVVTLVTISTLGGYFFIRKRKED